MNNIKLIISKNNHNDTDCNTSQDTDNEPNTNANSTLDFSIVRENPPAAAAKPPLSVPLNQECEMPKRDYKNAVKNSIAVWISPHVNTDVNNCVGSNVNDKNNSYPLQPSVKPKTNCNESNVNAKNNSYPLQPSVKPKTNCNESNVNAKNNSYPLQPSVKPQMNRNGKCNLLVVGDSHIKRVEKDLIVHHLNNKNVSLKCKNFDGADV